ncbi:MAG: hypothetical protein GY759_07335 [Chloroflexi bacterium]|nr:hypothetical protein [Chloroflexota bacterium]
MNSYNILSFDGGGIRGYLPAVLLNRLAEARPESLAKFDLFAGTSIGSMMALSLAYGLTPADICELFEAHGKTIFQDSLLDTIKDIGFMRGAKYGNKNLKRVLTEKFGEATLADLKRKVLIASFDLDNCPADAETPRMWKPKFFHNFPGEDSDGDQLLVDVALRSSAAPFYFPVYQGYADGFIVANNPSMCAVAQALSTNAAPLSRIAVFSLGTGLNQRYFPQQHANWGWRQWLFQMQPLQLRMYVMPLVYMMWEGSVDTANYQCKQLLGNRFQRLDPLLPKPIDIDAVNKMPDLKQVGMETDLSATVEWLDRHIGPGPNVE